MDTKPSAAVATARSIDAGSPGAITRRQALAALAAPAFVAHARAADLPRFACGVASGTPRPDRLVLWTRLSGADLAGPVEVQWELARDEAFTQIAARGTETAEGAWAHSVHAEPAGLEPGRGYWYRFTALGQRSATGRTRTAPAPDAAARLRFAIASCQRWDHGHFAGLRQMADDDLDLTIFLGDYIYEGKSGPNVVRAHAGGPLRTLDDYRARYAQYKSDPALQAAHAACPWLMVWDDHEVENDYANDVGISAQGAPFLQMRAAAYQAYWEHLPFPKAARPRHADMRVYDSFDWGRLARIIALDDRQYRDPEVCLPAGKAGGSTTVNAADCAALRDPKRSLLGAAQERWLADTWDPQRGWNLLAQQTLMARASRTSTAPGEDSRPGGRYWTDGWDGYAASRERLLTTMAARRTPNPVVLGGDVHAHFVADLKLDFGDAKAPVIASEFCGSSITSHGSAQARADEIRAFNPHIHLARSDQRGYIGFTLDEKRLEARLMAVERPDDPASPVGVLARFVVESGRPGPQAA